jgi:hypothetical protein
LSHPLIKPDNILLLGQQAHLMGSAIG